ncbi:MAG: ARMT1-like domain-containing protein [Desulfobacteraceae bacterium]|nr:ARMT1-like domain-containing protein [Desulfobacteraceae bacterium]
MQTSLDCLPCLLRQALFAIRRATADGDLQRRLLTAAARQLAGTNFTVSPPENSMHLYARIAEATGCADPFAGLKEESNRLAMDMRPELAARIEAAADPLQAAVRLAIAGNVIDYGAHHRFDARRSLDESFRRPLSINEYEELQRDLAKAGNILCLADNCGELVADGLLIERLVGMGKKVILAVKEKPIINDALAGDAEQCGLDRLCRVISNGTGCPGTPLRQCSRSFGETFASADLVISKGQGNFETLSLVRAPIYFLLTVKCEVVAAHIRELSGHAIKNGEPVLMKSRSGAAVLGYEVLNRHGVGKAAKKEDQPASS